MQGARTRWSQTMCVTCGTRQSRRAWTEGRTAACCLRSGLIKRFRCTKNARDLADLIAQSLIEVREGKVNSKVANAISYLGNAYLQALEVAEIEVRLQALERGLESNENEPETQD
jgi:hypothetical protein